MALPQRHRGRLLGKELIDWDFQITREDKDIIESTDPDTPIDMARRVEAHMPSDRQA